MKNTTVIKLRSSIATMLFVLLSGCLQVEMVGPVVGASVSIKPLRSDTAIAPDIITAGPEEVREVVGQETWDSLDAAGRFLLQGGIQVPVSELDGKTYYLVTATGGMDMDFDGDGQEDFTGTNLVKPLHAILTGAQLKKGARVNLLSEAIYQSVQFQLDNLTDKELRKLLNRRAARLVGDVNGDGKRGYLDIVKWSRSDANHPYKGSAILFERLLRTYSNPAYPDWLGSADAFNAIMSARWKPARPDSDYGPQLIGCTVSVRLADDCSMSKLPLLGIERSNPTVDEIMERVVVSHKWMANRFEQFLYEVPDDLLLLFRSITSIVIDADTIPSFFSPAVASIQLDADFFWHTDQERRSLSAGSDFRGVFANAVSFADLWRYVSDNDYAIPPFYLVDANGSRTLDHVVRLAAPLLFHELAHAADAYRPELFAQMPLSSKLLQLDVSTASAELVNTRPLMSPELFGIADVLYRGSPATAVEANYTPEEIGGFFEPDGASDLYGYSSQWEDTAMLFEEAMMAIHYGFSRDVAFTTVPDSPVGAVCSDFQVGWGVRGRIAEPQVSIRAREIVGKLLPERDYEQELTSLAKPISMNTSRDWCDNINLSRAILSQAAGKESVKKRLHPLPAPERRRYD